MLVEVTEETMASVPLKVTVVLLVLKFVPVIMMTAPGAPLLGLKLVIVGAGSTVKLDGLDTVTPFKVTVIGPVVAPTGTVTVNLFLLGRDAVTTAGVPLNSTTFSARMVLKLSPFISILAPTAPLVGLRLVMLGVSDTVKFEALLMV